MNVVKVNQSQWLKGLEQLRGAFKLIGPVKEKNEVAFQELAPGQAPEISYQNSRLSPKSLLFPQSETMLTCSLDAKAQDHDIYKPAEIDYSARVVLGLRPCDAKAIALVKLNFDTDQYKDPYWLNWFNATTFVGLACDQPESTCFCTSAGCGPYHEEGLDALMVVQQDHYLIRSLSEKGDQLLSTAGWQTPAAPAEAAAIEQQKTAAQERIISHVNTGNLRTADTMALYNADFWEDVSFACINCGTCTFTCPTCWCFDIQDETAGMQSRRMRNWDSCMFPIFSVHTTGHNPRGAKLQRVRQRFMHKLKYFVDKYESGIMCVGCGRCVRQCPVNIDIRRVCELMNNLGAGTACAVQEK